MDKMSGKKHPNLNIPTRVALLLMAVRFGFYLADIHWPTFQMIFVFVAVGGLIPLCIYAIWPRPDEPNDFLKEIAQALRVMAIYSILMVVFLIIFYAFIDTSFFPEKQAEIIKVALKNDPNANLEELTQSAEAFFSLRNFSILLLLGFMAASGFYAILFTTLKRVFIKKR